MGSVNAEGANNVAIIFGASRGFGDALAEAFLPTHSLFLSSRSGGGDKWQERAQSSNKIHCGALDVSASFDELFDYCRAVTSNAVVQNADEVVVIFNAGCISSHSYGGDNVMHSNTISDDISVNITGFCQLVSLMLSTLYDNNLKTPYQPQNDEEDQWIEYIIQDAKRNRIIE